MTYITATGPIGAEGRYWDSLIEGRLELPRCRGCGKWHWPAVWRCGECGSWDQEWVKQELAGTIFTWTRTHHAFGGAEAFSRPFITVMVELDAVPIRLMGTLKGETEDLKIGAAVVGTPATTQFGSSSIPALRWRLA